MTVTRAELEEGLAKVRANARDPRAGIHGPGSVSWRLHRDAILFLGSGRAALLQLAHPYVAHAIDQHSKTKTDAIGRFNRTFQNVYAMVFGDLDDALRSARRVHNIHHRVRGEVTEDVGQLARGHRYHANDEDALLWVFATLVDTAVMVHELVHERLSAADLAQYYEESKLFAYLFGIPDRVLPPDWAGFRRYVDRTVESGTLEVGAAGREIATFLLTPPNPAARPFASYLRIATAALMPPSLRAPFGLAYGARERVLFETSLRAMRSAWPLMPRRMRYLPAYVEARRRIAGLDGHDKLGRTLERVVLRVLATPA